MSEQDNEAVLAEFDGFMERFAPYIEGGRSEALERSKKLTERLTGIYQRPEKIEPLEIKELRTRPAGVEIRLADGRVLFASTDDARRIGEAASAEPEDTAKRKRDELESRRREQDQRFIDEAKAAVEQAKSSRRRV
jgi:hypothetical protein